MPSYPLKFAYSTINWGTKADLETMFAEIRATGWEAVELFDHSLDWMGTPEHLGKLLGGLQVATLFGGLELPIDRVQIAQHKRRIDYGALFGAEAYGLVGGSRLRWRPPNDAEYQALADACEELAIYAAGCGMRIGYHPHTACTIETAVEIDTLLGLTKVTQLCLDASHIALVDEDPVTHIRQYADRTSYVHVKDWTKGKFVELGQGTLGIDFPGFFAELEANKFGGWVVVENSRSDISPAESARINAEFIQSLGYSLSIPTREAS